MLNADETNGFVVEFTDKKVNVYEIQSLRPYLDPNNNEGLSNHPGAYYWFSLDSQNQRLYAGVGEARLETAIYKYEFPAASATTPSSKPFLESMTCIDTDTPIAKFRILKDPITKTVPLVVKDTSELTMDDVATGAAMPKANLSRVNQKLYDCIAGPKFTLNTPDFPDFAQAIEYSIRTPGLWCYKNYVRKVQNLIQTSLISPKPIYVSRSVKIMANRLESRMLWKYGRLDIIRLSIATRLQMQLFVF